MGWLQELGEYYCYEICFLAIGILLGIFLTVLISMIGEMIEFRRQVKRDKMRLQSGQKTSHMAPESPPWDYNEGPEDEPDDE